MKTLKNLKGLNLLFSFLVELPLLFQKNKSIEFIYLFLVLKIVCFFIYFKGIDVLLSESYASLNLFTDGLIADL